jgi:hypothetical protein
LVETYSKLYQEFNNNLKICHSLNSTSSKAESDIVVVKTVKYETSDGTCSNGIRTLL